MEKWDEEGWSVVFCRENMSHENEATQPQLSRTGLATDGVRSPGEGALPWGRGFGLDAILDAISIPIISPLRCVSEPFPLTRQASTQGIQRNCAILQEKHH